MEDKKATLQNEAENNGQEKKKIHLSINNLRNFIKL